MRESGDRQSRRVVWILMAVCATALAAPSARADLEPGDCPPQDLLVNLNTGYDENAEATIPSGQPDDDWDVLVDPSMTGPVPRDAGVVAPNSAWLTMPDSAWISASTPSGPNGVYVYEHCWCMDDSYSNPLLTFAIRADDDATVFLNGFEILGLPDGTFNDPIPIGISVIDPAKFNVGLNCLVVQVEQKYGGPHGFNLTGSVTADDGRCCGCYPIPPDAEAWWRLDEAAGPIAADSIDGHDGVYTEFGGPTGPPPTPDPDGCVAGALLFDGIDDYVEVPDDPGLDFAAADDLTIDAWIRTDTITREPIVNKKDLVFNSPGYALMVGGGVLTFEMADGASTITCNGGSGLDDNECHFVAVTLDRDDPDGLVLYIDGLPVTDCNPIGVASLANALSLQIGARPSLAPGAMWWRGRLDEIEIFRRALTPTEIHEIWLAGEAGKCPPEVETPCDESGYPVCDGACPPGETCLVGPQQNCACEPIPCGAQGDYPECNGYCPQNLTCEVVPGSESCQCVDQFPACGNTSYPECNGVCPQGQECKNIFGTSLCECEPAAPACGDGLYPTCGGACAANQKCVRREVPAPGCECRSCADLGGSGLGGIVVGWPGTKTQLRWTGAGECAQVYNAYRFTGAQLTDADRNGLADSYGDCFAGDIIGHDVSDPSAPPPGQVHWYLVTGEYFEEEGSLGDNSAGLERPNLAPCP